MKLFRRTTPTNCIASMLIASSTFVSMLVAEDKPDAKPNTSSGTEQAAAEKLAARRLEFSKKAVKECDFLLAPDFIATLTVEPEPLLRFTNPVSGLQDGGFFVWKSEAGRPMVGAKIFLTSEDLWIHEFQSLAPVPFRVTRNGEITWEPKRAGVEVKAVPNAPVPANSPVQRLIQMRDIAKRFTASDEFERRPQSDVLRLLTKPLVRFGSESSDTLDGALFTHAHGTDPELMIVLEALKSDGAYRWQYSLAPMTGYALKASLDDKQVWDVEWRKPPADRPVLIVDHVSQFSELQVSFQNGS